MGERLSDSLLKANIKSPNAGLFLGGTGHVPAKLDPALGLGHTAGAAVGRVPSPIGAWSDTPGKRFPDEDGKPGLFDMWTEQKRGAAKSALPKLGPEKHNASVLHGGGDETKHYPVEKIVPKDFVGPLPKGTHADAQVTQPAEALDIKDYLALVRQVEQHYQDQARKTGKPYDSNQAVSGMRAIYGYEGGSWDRMIPDAPNVKPPCDVQGKGDGHSQAGDFAGCDPMKEVIDQFFTMKKSDKGELVHGESRLVRLPNGDLVDPGHLYTGIDTQLHPGIHPLLGNYGIDNRDGSTWSGDVGSAIVRHKEAGGKLSVQQAFDKYASVPDLNSDLDGYNLGKRFDTKRGLTDQLSDYYLPSDPVKQKQTQHAPAEGHLAQLGLGGPAVPYDYRSRYSLFTQNAGIDTKDGKVSDAGRKKIGDETDHFAEAYSRRNGLWGIDAVWGSMTGSNDFDPTDDRSKGMADRFSHYLDQGMQREQQR